MNVGFIGLGAVGGKLAGSLLRNGISLSVFDLDGARVQEFVQRGARDGGSAAEVMQYCDVVITSLPSPAASAAVLDEMMPHIAGKTWMEMSTTDATQIVAQAQAVAAAGGRAVDCPV